MAKAAEPQVHVYNPPAKEVPKKTPLAAVSGLGELQQDYSGQLDSARGADARTSGIVTPEFRQALYQENRVAVVEAAVKRPAAPAEFLSLQVGPETHLEFEANQAPQVELSSALLRRFSPFLIQVEPPLAFGEDAGLLAPGKKVSVDTFSTAARGFRGYENARSTLSRSTLAVGVNGKVGSVQEFLTVNSRKSPTRGGASRDIKTTNLGEPAIADLMTAADTAWQLSSIMQLPPLVLLINPQTLQMSYTKLQQFQDRTRYGFIFQAWGEEQPKLSITARCGAFVSGGRGVQEASRRDSLAWQNLMTAFQFYKSNGYLYDTLGKSNAHNFVGALSIHYDQWIYYGHLGNFNWTYDENNLLGGVEFSLEFNVSGMLDTAQQPFVVGPMRGPTPSPSDPRYQGLENRARNAPAEFSIGLNEDGTPRVTSQGRVVTGDSFGLLVPAAVETLLEQRYGWTRPQGGDTQGRPISNRGFQTSGSTDTLPGERQVNVAVPRRAFGLR